MNIFDKRPLSLILCITLGSFVFFSFYESLFLRLTSVFLILSAFVITFINPLKKYINPILVRVAAISSLFAILFSFVYFDLWFKAYDRYDGEVHIVGEIQEIKEATNSSSVIIKTTGIDGTAFSKYKLAVYLDNEKYYGYSIGSKIELKGEITPFSNSDSFDANGYYTARGISGAVKEVTEFNITDVGEYPISYKIKDFRESICRRIIINSNKDVGGLLCALLLGEKDYLPLGTKIDFARIGISHILALSGMHLAILSVGFSKLLLLLKVGKKPATLLTILFTIIYMFLTGLSLSVMRAGYMLIISALLFLLGNTKDSMTSLFTSVGLICIIQPYAIFDLSLWLSALATLGIVVMSEYQSEKYKKPSFLIWVFTSLTSSFFAISATFAITTLKFDGFSLISPISTLFIGVLVELFIYLGIAVLIFASLIPIKFLLIPVGNLILYLADFFSNIDGIYVSSNFPIIVPLSLIFSALFFLFFIIKVKHKKSAIILLGAMLSIIFSISSILTYSHQNKTSLTYFSITNEHLILTENNKILAVDIATYDDRTAYSVYNDITYSNLTKIDKYVITHYSYYLSEAVLTLIDSLLVREIYLPAPQTATEERILSQIYVLSEKADFDLNIYTTEDCIEIGETKIFPLYHYKLGERKQNILTILHKNTFYTYITDDILTGDIKNMASDIIAQSHVIILGRHKSGNSTCEFLRKYDNLEEIIFATSKISIDEETYKYYIDKGTDIYFEVWEKELYVE